ncbi:MAG: porin [Bacteriovoracaceae bacterium]
MKKKSVLVLALAFVQSIYASSNLEDIQNKISELDNEIESIKKYKTDSGSASIIQEQLEMLEVERKKYRKLLKESKRSESQASTRKVAPINDKSFPTALKKDLENYRHFQDESIPLEKRYELLLIEIDNLNDINKKLSKLSDIEKGDSLKLLTQNKEKLQVLNDLKLKYEIKVFESEQNEISEMKKNGVRLGVMFDGYYQWDLNRPKRVGSNNAEIPYKNYNNRHNDFTVNLMELNVYKSFKDLDFYADIDFGEQPEQNKSVGTDAVTHHIGQALLRYRPKNSNNLTFTAGKFYSHFGLEVPKNIENRTYSRPFYFTLL